MFALGVSFLYGLAVAAAIGVALTMIAALTLLPAHAGLHRPQGDEPEAEAEPGRERPAHRGRGQQGLLAELGRPGPALPLGSPPASPWPSSSSSPCPSSPCASARPTRAPTRRARRPGSPSTCCRRASGPASTGPLMLVGVVQPDQHGRRRRRGARAVASRPTWPRWPTRSSSRARPGSGDVMLLNVYPGLRAPGRCHDRPGEPPAGRDDPRGRRRLGRQRAGRRHDRHLHRLRQRAERQAAALHRARRAPVVPAADDGVPSVRDPAHRGRHEPALHRRRVRHPGRRLPVGRPAAPSSASAAPVRSRPSCP